MNLNNIDDEFYDMQLTDNDGVRSYRVYSFARRSSLSSPGMKFDVTGQPVSKFREVKGW